MAGVEVLQNQTRFAPTQPTRRKTSPAIAALLSLLVPGLGAGYNGQTSKAVFHFSLFASFFQLGTMMSGAPFFVWAAFGTWLFATVDAYRTSQLIRAGLAPKEEEDAIARRLYGNPLAWGVVLVVLGSLILLHTFFNISLVAREILPIVLVALGVFMIFDQWQRKQLKKSSGTQAFDQHPPLSVVDSGRLDSARLPDFTKSGATPRAVERLPWKS